MAGNRGKGAGYALIQAYETYGGDDCVIWPMAKLPDGYGHFGHLGKVYRAHTFMCTLVHGKRPTPKHECAHSCHRRDCVNRNHLSWKTRSGNQLDRRLNGTTNNAYWAPYGKLPLAKRNKIKALKGKKSKAEIAEMFGVTANYVMYLHKQKPK